MHNKCSGIEHQGLGKCSSRLGLLRHESELQLGWREHMRAEDNILISS